MAQKKRARGMGKGRAALFEPPAERPAAEPEPEDVTAERLTPQEAWDLARIRIFETDWKTALREIDTVFALLDASKTALANGIETNLREQVAYHERQIKLIRDELEQA